MNYSRQIFAQAMAKVEQQQRNKVEDSSVCERGRRPPFYRGEGGRSPSLIGGNPLLHVGNPLYYFHFNCMTFKAIKSHLRN
jgi:hypothetical protein